MKKLLITLLSIGSLSLACEGAPMEVDYPETKIASWYGKDFHGKITASGYVYDMNQDTCASMDYPFGTVLRVTNPKNGNSVDVVVTDTGAFKKKYGRDIDLSRSAFAKLDKLGVGVMDVNIVMIDDTKQFKYKKGLPRLKEADYE
ncbi:MAG: septal ring lytic transglycosylase RlpA family protein [Paraclostridium sp.]